MSVRDDFARLAGWIVFVVLTVVLTCLGAIAFAYFINGI